MAYWERGVPIPTQVGDVLILRTDQSFTIYAVGQASNTDQQDFRGQENVKYVRDRAAAVAEAKALLVPDRRILFRDLDTNDWSEISH